MTAALQIIVIHEAKPNGPLQKSKDKLTLKYAEYRNVIFLPVDLTNIINVATLHTVTIKPDYSIIEFATHKCTEATIPTRDIVQD